MAHPLHSICPYFAMFPADFVAKHVLAFSDPGEIVLDPFAGRGTTVFESLRQRRQGLGTDINPVAVCVAGAKARPPIRTLVLKRLDELHGSFQRSIRNPHAPSEFFEWCFHHETLRELLYLRKRLDWRASGVDRFLAATLLGVLHGESHKTPNCLSNRMPRTISTKPDYSVRWWKERNLRPERRNTFKILKQMVMFRYSDDLPDLKGYVKEADARKSGKVFRRFDNSVKLVVTSPPYLDTTNYLEDQWLRLWFLGGNIRPSGAGRGDGRHTSSESYWKFLEESWKGMSSLLAPKSTIVVRIGGVSLNAEEIREGLVGSVRNGLDGRRVRIRQEPLASMIRNSQTNSFRPGRLTRRFEYDAIFSISG